MESTRSCLKDDASSTVRRDGLYDGLRRGAQPPKPSDTPTVGGERQATRAFLHLRPCKIRLWSLAQQRVKNSTYLTIVFAVNTQKSYYNFLHLFLQKMAVIQSFYALLFCCIPYRRNCSFRSKLEGFFGPQSSMQGYIKRIQITIIYVLVLKQSQYIALQEYIFIYVQLLARQSSKTLINHERRLLLSQQHFTE